MGHHCNLISQAFIFLFWLLQDVYSAKLQKEEVVILAEKSCSSGFGLHDDGCGEYMLLFSFTVNFTVSIV